VASARLIVEASNLAEQYPHRAASENYLFRKVRSQFDRVVSGEPEDDSGARLSVRWMWLDRMIEFIRGERSTSLKNVSLSEEPLSDYSPGFPMMPVSLIIEGLAWTGGILANDQRGFLDRVVLAKINKAVFHRPAFPGDQLRYTAVIERNEPEGAFIRGTSHVGDELQAEIDLFLAHLGDNFQEVQGDLVDPAETLIMLQLFGVYDIGRTPDGKPIDVAEKLLNAEREAQAAAEA
jgi:3-hydroxyacyl-[acyl-carrier-protein] dehydratase